MQSTQRLFSVETSTLHRPSHPYSSVVAYNIPHVHDWESYWESTHHSDTVPKCYGIQYDHSKWVLPE